MFEDATFHSSGILHDKTPQWMLLALTVNLFLLSAFLLNPLFYPDSLSAHALSRILFAPPPPARLTPPVTRAVRQASPVNSPIQIPLTVPRHIPSGADSRPDPAPPAAGPYVDFSQNSIAGADLPPAAFPHTQPPVVVHPAQPDRVRLTQGVTDGLLTYKVTPTYPAIGRAVGVSGTVVLAATISKAGAIENLRVMGGPVLLQQSALDAVRRWRYRPYLLDGQPVEVETTINVVFSLGRN